MSWCLGEKHVQNFGISKDGGLSDTSFFLGGNPSSWIGIDLIPYHEPPKTFEISKGLGHLKNMEKSTVKPPLKMWFWWQLK